MWKRRACCVSLFVSFSAESIQEDATFIMGRLVGILGCFLHGFLFNRWVTSLRIFLQLGFRPNSLGQGVVKLGDRPIPCFPCRGGKLGLFGGQLLAQINKNEEQIRLEVGHNDQEVLLVRNNSFSSEEITLNEVHKIRNIPQPLIK